MGMDPPPLLDMVAFGDSKTLGLNCCTNIKAYRADLLNLFRPEINANFIAVQEVSGQNCQQAKDAVDAWVASQPASANELWIMVGIGTNDLPAIPGTFETNYAYLLDALNTKWPTATVIAIKPWSSLYVANSATLATHIDNVLATRGAWATSINEANFLTAALLSDGIHPTAAGYNATARAIKTAMGY